MRTRIPRVDDQATGVLYELRASVSPKHNLRMHRCRPRDRNFVTSHFVRPKLFSPTRAVHYADVELSGTSREGCKSATGRRVLAGALRLAFVANLRMLRSRAEMNRVLCVCCWCACLMFEHILIGIDIIPFAQAP